MNTRFLTILASIGAFLTALGGADLSGVWPLLPDNIAKWCVTILPLGAALLHFINAFGDFADNGKIDGSWKVKMYPALMWLTLGALSFPMLACTGLSLSVTPDGRVVGQYQIPKQEEPKEPVPVVADKTGGTK